MATQSSITRLFTLVHNNHELVTGNLDYPRVTDAITRLAAVLAETETDETTWYIGEGGGFDLADLIEAAYWHYSEWHGGQSSPGYAALSALGLIYGPGMSDGPEPESGAESAYHGLNNMAFLYFGQ